MNSLSKLGLAAAALSLAPPVWPQENTEVYDRVDLSASAELEVENDVLVAVVFAEVEANDQNDASNEVNTAIQWAVERARGADAVRFETAQYSTRPVYVNGRRITGWVARQSLRLESEDAGALSELLGVLQERVAVQSVDYDVSRQARETAEDALIAEALAKFNHRAELVARELGRDGFRIVRINVGTSGRFPVAYRDNATTLRAESAPALEAGEQTITVSVNGTVELDAPR